MFREKHRADSWPLDGRRIEKINPGPLLIGGPGLRCIHSGNVRVDFAENLQPGGLREETECCF